MEENTTTRPLLILDLDETLIFGSEDELDRSCDFRVGPFFIYQRPSLHEFLTAVKQHHDLAIY
jgi:RNA polymerase II subunit A small phosphatase-like protein